MLIFHCQVINSTCEEKQFYGSYRNRYKLKGSCKRHNDVEAVLGICMSHILMHSFSSLRNACMPLLTQSCLHKYPFFSSFPFPFFLHHPPSIPPSFSYTPSKRRGSITLMKHMRYVQRSSKIY